ncbi:MAG: alpha/beta hydrolase [Bacteroidetes bacterium]|nr:alpha/beta hydrolase [Bacteroidota bacterium]
MLLLFISNLVYSQIGASEVLLWEEGAPGAMGEEEKDIPILIPHFAAKEKTTGAAVMICPGGGYAGLAMDHEGKQIAEWFNELGIHAFVLRYRLGKWDGSGYQHPIMMNDAKRGFRMIRANAKKWGINPDEIGVMGFSAGGHLASTLGTHFDDGNPASSDQIEQFSCMPNYMILGYPVISLNTKYAHAGSRRHLLGATPNTLDVDNLSNETQVSVLTPPTFLFHTDEDKGVPPENSVLFYLALREKGVPAELHIYEKGRHGVGFAPNDPVLSSWKNRLHDWLKNRGVLE